MKLCKKKLHSYPDDVRGCPECKRDYAKAWALANPEKCAEKVARSMTKKERIAALEAKVAQLEARVAALEVRPVVAPVVTPDPFRYGPGIPSQPVQLPDWKPGDIICEAKQ